MSGLFVEKPSHPDMMNVEEVANYLRKSQSWVYKNWKIIGGRKLGGSLIFPSKEDLYERVLFSKEKRMEVRVHRERNKVHGNLVQNENRGERRGIQEKGGGKQSKTSIGDPNRHGIFGTG